MHCAAVRKRSVEMLGELGEAGAGDDEEGPGSENDECPGPGTISRRCGVTRQSRLPGPLLEPAGNKAETNQDREIAAVLVVEKSEEFVSVSRAPLLRLPAEAGIAPAVVRTETCVLRSRPSRSHHASLGLGVGATLSRA